MPDNINNTQPTPPENVVPPVVPIEKDPSKVTVEKSLLEKILQQNNKLEQELAILRQSVSQAKLAQAESKVRPKEKPRVYLKIFNGKIVTSWKSEKQEYLHSQVDGKVIGEILKARYYYIDGTDSGIVDQVAFTRADEQAWARIIETRENTFLLDFEDKSLFEGILEINKAFVNP